MMKIQEKKAISFDDVLIVPGFSEVRSRSDVVLSSTLDCFPLSFPFIGANMDTVCGPKMATMLGKFGGLGILHRNIELRQRFEELRNVNIKGIAIGVNEDIDFVISKVNEGGNYVIVLDIAHGDSKHALDAIDKLSNKITNETSTIIGGNVATPQAVRRMADAGAKVVKVGIGPGSACTTRMVTGVGYPQLSAISECSHMADSMKVQTIADGGIRTSGDAAKALAAGADFVMLGNLLAGTNEAPGDMIVVDGATYKEYRGMASREAGSPYVEGVSGLVPAKGPVIEVIKAMCAGLASTCSYVGADSLGDLSKKAVFVESLHSNSIIGESNVHDIVMNR